MFPQIHMEKIIDQLETSVVKVLRKFGTVGVGITYIGSLVISIFSESEGDYFTLVG